jgi:hypothetical protein
MKAKYTSPYTVGKRQTVYIDANDPRVRNPIKYGITTARLGSDFVIVTDGGATTPIGKLSSIQNSGGPTYSTTPDPFSPTSTNFIKPSDISNIAVAWFGSTLVITFDFDFSDNKNKYVTGFEYTLTSDGSESTIISSLVLNKAGTTQTINFTYTNNINAFNIFKSSFSLLKIRAKDSFGNVGEYATLSVIPSYTPDLCTPEISANSIARGYTVNFLETCEKEYDFVSIEEVVSSANTAPSSGYQQVYLSEIRPATIITPTTESRWVKARYTDGTGSYGSYSNIVQVTPESIVAADTTGPDNVSSVTASSGIDTSGYLGFNAYADISWPAVTGGGIRGYRIRFSNDNGTTYSYVDSPGTGTTYRLGGLAIGSTYKIAVATYDEYNNLSSSFVAGPDVTVTGTPSVSNYITGGPFEFGVGVGGVSTNKGLYFDPSNYWYVNATNSARLKVGGSTSNYLEWNGATFAVDGNLTARQGTFAGNVSIITGGSLIAGTSGAQSVIVNSNGLSANNTAGAALTEILTTPIGTGTTTPGSNSLGSWTTGELINFFTKSAMIGGWLVTDTLIKDRSNQFQLDSTNKRISITGTTPVGEGNTNFTVKFGTALSGSGTNTTNIFEAGTTSQVPKFYITQTGVLHAVDADLLGQIRTGDTGNVMKFGVGAGDSGEDGIHINSANYWYSTAEFSLGGGILRGDHETVTIDLYEGNANFYMVQMPSSDDDGYAGDPTITIKSDGKIVKGRRLIYSTLIADAARTTTIDPVTKEGTISINGTNRTVKIGDLLFIDE